MPVEQQGCYVNKTGAVLPPYSLVRMTGFKQGHSHPVGLIKEQNEPVEAYNQLP